MKRFYIFLTASALAIFLTLLLAYPYTLISMEGDDLFLFNRLFIGGVLERSTGVAVLIQDFVCQFFSTPWVGALIYTAIITAATYLNYRSLAHLSREKLYWLALIPAPMVAAFSFPLISHSLNYLFYSILLYIFTIIRSSKWRFVYALLIAIPSFCLITWYEAALLIITFGAIELTDSRKKVTAALMLIPLVLTLVTPWLWSVSVNFIPLSQRPFTGIDETFSIGIACAYMVMFASTILPSKIGSRSFVGYIVSPLAIAGFVAVIMSYGDLRFSERTSKISTLADQKEWEEIIAELPLEEATQSRIFTTYLLLAMSATENLPQILFATPLNSPELLMFRHDTRPFYANFNRQFYENIGIWNEAFHQAFEYGVTQRENECFKTLRFKTDYAINSGNLGIARHYLDLLAQSSNNGKFVSERRTMLESKAREHSKPLPYMSDTFTGAYPMPSEMFRLYERNLKSKKLLDYVLCSLLLNKEVDKFGIILSKFNLYKGQELPRPYAEAIAVLAARDTSAHMIADYDHNLDKYFIDFKNRADQHQDVSEYASTYWNYLYFRQLEQNTDYSGK